MKLESLEDIRVVKPTINSLSELHDFLGHNDCDFSRDSKSFYYVVEFVDNSVDSVLFCSCYDTPVLALRELPAILEKSKSNVDYVSIHLRYALPKTSSGKVFVREFSENCVLSPYIYFNKPDKTTVDSSTDVSKVDNQ